MRASRHGVPLRFALVGAALLHLVLLPSVLHQAQDLYVSLFYGKMWSVHGANPHVAMPLDLANDPWLRFLPRWRDQPSVYGPLWTMLSGGVVRVTGGSLLGAFLLMKAIMVGATIGTCALMAQAARARGRNAGATVLLYAWNPVVLAAVGMGAHPDGLVALFLVGAVVAHDRARTLSAVALLTAAALVKPYAALALIVYLAAPWRRARPTTVRALGVGSAMTALAYAPFWEGARTFTGLARATRFATDSPATAIEAAIRWFTNVTVADALTRTLGAALLFATIVVVARRARAAADPWPGVGLVLAVYGLVSPWYLYWHHVGLLALAAVATTSATRAGAYAFSATAMLPVGGVSSVLRYAIPVGVYARSSRAQR